MQRRRTVRRIRTGPGTVQLTITKDRPKQGWGVKHRILERGDASNRDRSRLGGMHVEWVTLRVGEGTPRISPSDALSDDAASAHHQRCIDKVACAFRTDPRVTRDSCCRRSERGKICQLMDHNIRPSGVQRTLDRISVKYIGYDHADGSVAKGDCLCLRARHPSYLVPRIEQQG